ncbi:MAG: hypothetical protein BGN85_08840 [Alphaproteobacteria bacterium 64-11]|nr:MAG: hypothetical protein BGN85_08840 [Alphaproteobacteria bacterium 64-11]
MARTIPVVTRKSLEEASSGDPVLLFATISHRDLVEDITLVLDGADYVLDGITYSKSWFELDLISDDDQPPTAQFTFPNVDRVAFGMLSGVTYPARVSFKLIAASNFDLTVDPRTVLSAVTVETIYSADLLFLTDITIDAMQVQGTLRGFDYRQEVWPSRRATQDLLPGVFMR